MDLMESLGSTVRSTRKQHGGASWAKITLDAIKTNMPAEVAFNKTYQWNDADVVQKYITNVEYQDELFEAAIKTMYTDIQLDPANVTVDQIISKKDAIRTNQPVFITYLTEIGKLITLENISKDTKLGTLLQEPMLSLLLNPSRVQNMFIQQLADICIVQKKIPTILSALKDNTDLQRERAQRYVATVNSNIWNITSAPPRDGFYVSGDVAFWNSFVTQCTADDIEGTLGNGVNPNMDNGELAAIVFLFYKVTASNLKEVVLQRLSAEGKKAKTGVVPSPAPVSASVPVKASPSVPAKASPSVPVKAPVSASASAKASAPEKVPSPAPAQPKASPSASAKASAPAPVQPKASAKASPSVPEKASPSASAKAPAQPKAPAPASAPAQPKAKATPPKPQKGGALSFESEQLDKEVMKGLSLRQILNSISIEQLQFIVHLIHRINVQEPTTLQKYSL